MARQDGPPTRKDKLGMTQLPCPAGVDEKFTTKKLQDGAFCRTEEGGNFTLQLSVEVVRHFPIAQ